MPRKEAHDLEVLLRSWAARPGRVLLCLVAEEEPVRAGLEVRCLAVEDAVGVEELARDDQEERRHVDEEELVRADQVMQCHVAEEERVLVEHV